MGKITSIFVVLETVFLYYGTGAFLFNSNPKVLFSYLPGVGYIFKTLFPQAWFALYHPTDIGHVVTREHTFSLAGPLHFLSVLWIVFVIAAITTAIIYAIKLKSIS